MPTIALSVWPLIALILFKVLGRAQGLIWTVLVGFLFLPEATAFDLPGLPEYGKYSAISLSLVLGALVTRGESQTRSIHGPKLRGLLIALLILVFISLLITILDNTEALNRNGRFQRGHSWRDMISMSSELVIALIPFVLAARWLHDPKHHRALLHAFVVLGLFYSLLALFEIRMSPQLNSWVYGFFPHSWRQHIRGGGFRPIIFLQHGLVVGFFLMTTVLAAFGMAKADKKKRAFYIFSGLWLLLILFLTRNLGATMLALVFLPILLFVPRRTQIGVVASIAILFMAYPAVRGALPIDRFVDFVESISANRAQSFVFRLENEAPLLERAAEKPLFGWGGWGRSRMVDEAGRDISVTDGLWILQLGKFGWAGFIGMFGLMTLPLIFLMRRKEQPPIEAMALAMIMAANLLYLLPNAFLGPMSWMCVGALAGYLQFFSPRAATKEQDPTAPMPRETAYSRFPPQVNQGGGYRRKL